MGKTRGRWSVLLCWMIALGCLVGDGCQRDVRNVAIRSVKSPEKTGTSAARLIPGNFFAEDFESYSNGDDISDANGGSGWFLSTWEWDPDAMAGANFSNEQAQSGSLSLKFAADADGLVARQVNLHPGEGFQTYVRLAATTDAPFYIRISGLGWGAPTRFQMCLNCQTAGQLSVYDYVSTTWSDVGAFTDGDWNQVALVGNQWTNLMDVFLNGTRVAGGVHGTGTSELGCITYEASPINGQSVYIDSISQIPVPHAYEDFESYTVNTSLNGQDQGLDVLSSGIAWFTNPSPATVVWPPTSAWSVVTGTVTLSHDQWESGNSTVGNSIKFGATSHDRAKRELQMSLSGNMTRMSMLEASFYAAASMDAKASLELRCDTGSTSLMNFRINLNYDSPGSVSTYNALTNNWTTITTFTGGQWNTLDFTMNANDSTMVIAFNTTTLLSVGANAGDCVTHLYFDAQTSNGQYVYWDSLYETDGYDEMP